MNDTYTITPVAKVISPYKEKFGIPRQPGLATSLESRIRLLPGFDKEEVLRGLQHCSHIWLLFIFSECIDKGWNPLVRPPRLGGNKRMGVFATRSPFRPNPIGLSPVKLIAIESDENHLELVVSGGDLLDGTPIIDIKPYLPYSDAITEAECSFAENISFLEQPIKYSDQAKAELTEAQARLQQPLNLQISQLLKCDPRPAYKKNDSDKSYGVRLHDLNIRFRITDCVIFVDSITTETP